MAMIHEQLYHSDDLARINFEDYLTRLVEEIRYAHWNDADSVDFRVSVHRVFIPVDAAIPCALIINELITNALKHASRPEEGLTIAIEAMDLDDSMTSIKVSDNGTEAAKVPDLKNASTMGFNLVNALVRQLQGAIDSRVNSEGLSFEITFSV